MWFGNLVTMDWWDDLWLNEAFATCLSYKACSMGGPWVDNMKGEAWIHMAGYKRYGLNDDLLPTTRGIQSNCTSTDEAESMIDGITYGKGCSVIKQLIFLLGWDNFCAGLHLYFQRYCWGNTTLEDFIMSLQDGYNQEVEKSGEGEKIDLMEWSNMWLRTKGPNKISLVYENDNGKIKNAQIKQAFCKYGDEIYRW
jgi:aminopeptidase N